MSINFTHSIEIKRPASEVFAYIANAENNPDWQDGMRSCRWTSKEPMTLGATYAQEARFLGLKIDTHFKVSECREGQSISIESTKSTFPIQITRSVEKLDENRCQVTAHIRGQPTGFFKMFSGMVKRNVQKDYQKLKVMLESHDRC